MTKRALTIFGLLTIAASAAAPSPLAAAASQQSAVPALPLNQRPGFWSPSEQEAGYRSMETVFPSRRIAAGGPVLPLPLAKREMPVTFTYEHKRFTTDDFMKTQRVSGLLIVRKGQTVLERYGLGRTPNDRWTSFSIAKSITATLLGAAIRDGSIKSVEEPLTHYLPELKGGAYDGVSLKDALTMRSGVDWKEDYYEPDSDFSRHAHQAGPTLYKILSAKPRVAKPGTTFHYSTGESNLLGAAVARATGKPLATYLSEKIWRPFGMEADGIWITSPEGIETGGICFSATLRDYGRLGMFMLAEGRAERQSVLPPGWMEEATRPHVKEAFGELGYGYQWWTGPGRAYRGIGIMGQAMFVDPDRELVVVIQSAWARAGGPTNYGPQWAFIDAAIAAADRETAAGR